MFKNKNLTATSLGLRGAAGGYLLYLSYSLTSTIQDTKNTIQLIFFILVVTIFTAVGGALIFFSIKALIKSEYDKGNNSIADEAGTKDEELNAQEDDINSEESTEQEDNADSEEK